MWFVSVLHGMKFPGPRSVVADPACEKRWSTARTRLRQRLIGDMLERTRWKRCGGSQVQKYKVGFIVYQTVHANSIWEAERAARDAITASQSLWRLEVGAEPCEATRLLED